MICRSASSSQPHLAPSPRSAASCSDTAQQRHDPPPPPSLTSPPLPLALICPSALAADARRLRDRYLREMATTKDPQGELVTSAASDFLEFLAKELDGGVAPEADAMDAAARPARVTPAEREQERERSSGTVSKGRFAEALLKELAGIEIPSERIYGLGTGPKVKVLQQLQQMPQHQGLTLHFVEDRLATLKNVMKEPALDGWNLYLVNWGYNTPKEREEAGGISRIEVIDLPDFSKKLK